MSLNTILATAPLATTGFHIKATGTTLGNSLIWDNGTNVGIGNTNTSYTLDVSGSGRYNGNYAGHLLNVQNTNASYYSSTDYYDNAGTEKLIVGYGNASTGNALASKAIIYGTSGVGLNFYTNGSTTAKMVIDTSGNVGIGTTSPTALLQIAGAQAGVSGKNLTISYNGTYYAEYTEKSITAFNNELTFGTGTGGTEKMRIVGGGNVGIGTGTPVALLDVYGGVQSIYKTDSGVGTIGAGIWLSHYGPTRANLTGAGIFSLRDNGDSNYHGLAFKIHNTATATDAAATAMTITSGGNVGIGTTSPGCRLEIAGGYVSLNDNALRWRFASDANHATVFTTNYNGPITYGYSGAALGYQAIGVIWTNTTSAYNYNNSTTWQQTSDIRIKENIRPITGALSKICSLNPTHFEYKNKLGKTKTGFIAQEFEQVFEGHVIESEPLPEYQEYFAEGEKIKSIDADLIPYLVKAIQEQNQTIQSLQEQINILAK